MTWSGSRISRATTITGRISSAWIGRFTAVFTQPIAQLRSAEAGSILSARRGGK